MKYCRFLLLICLCFLLPKMANGQCNNWAIKATLTNASTCAANGSFNVTVTGPDAANLTNIQFGIPLAANGFSVPLNSSASFSSIPAGTYEVSAVANCGGAIVGKNAQVEIPGNYTPPTISSPGSRPSFTCGKTGTISASIINGAPPFQYNLTSAPPAYTGPRTITSGNRYASFTDLPQGNYAIRVTDVCNSGTAAISIPVGTIDPATVGAALVFATISNAGCDTLVLANPVIGRNNVGWDAYFYDTTFQIRISISGGISANTGYRKLGGSGFRIKLPAGKTLKDCYGQIVTYTIKPLCGPEFTLTQSIPTPWVNVEIGQHCNIDFDANVAFQGPICLPITYSIRNTSSGATMGPYITNTANDLRAGLPLGNYDILYQTADGYNGTGSMGARPVSGIPYAVSVLNGSVGFNQFIEGFRFSITSSGAVSNMRTIELFSGPAGYSFLSGSWQVGNYYDAYENNTPTPSTLKYPTGNYVWKITDECGVYYLPITVGVRDLYQFTVSPPAQERSCDGLVILPGGTAYNNGIQQPIRFALLLNGVPWTQVINGYPVWQTFAQGTALLLREAGTYTILPTSASRAINLATYYYSGNFSLSYPNSYASSYTFTYTASPLAVDINNTQGFLCKGGSPGQGQLYANGKGGIPFKTAPNPHYQYFLASSGNGINGPYISSNTSGIFTGFGGNANAMYDLKIVDSCSAFAVQKIKILDLGTARLIASSKYVACSASSITLSAIYLPGATYSWTGPNGFTSSVRDPVIYNAGPQNAGVYRVSITTTQCPGVLTDTTLLALSQNPPKPELQINCSSDRVTIKVTNPATGYKYQWSQGYGFSGSYYFINRDVDSTFRMNVNFYGKFNALATDTTTGCTTTSDTVNFGTNPNVPLVATIYSPHLQLCPGDTSILVAMGGQDPDGGVDRYQWFKNGQPITGATGKTYITNVPGNYRVRLETGPCSVDTSDEVTVANTTVPTASISASRLNICETDTAQFSANQALGYSYTWHLNGTTIPGAGSPVLNAGMSGYYYVTVSNGGCIANSDSLYLTVNPAPVLNLTPTTQQDLCPGDTVHFSTTFNSQYTYTWLRDGSPIPGASGNSFNTTMPGVYTIQAATPLCPKVNAGRITVTQLPGRIDLGSDTVFCAPGSFTKVLTAASGYSQIIWSTGETSRSITVNAPGRYWIQAMNKCGTFSDTLHIRTLAEYLPALPDDTLICNEVGTVILRVPSILQNVQWSDGETAFARSITRPGLYWVQGESPCGIIYDTVLVRFCLPNIQSIAPTDTICEGGCARLSASVTNYPQRYFWRMPGAQPDTSADISPRACYNQPGIYTVALVVSNAGGADSSTAVIVVAARPVPRFVDTTMTIGYKKMITLPSCADAVVISWYKDDSLICANCKSITVQATQYRSVYHCVVSNGGCADSCDYKMQVVDIPHDVWLPDAFTPNGDGRNDAFRVITDNPNVYGIDLSVYNRYGQKVHVSHTSYDGWDGRVDGKDADAGTYFYLLHYKVLGTDETFNRKGDLILIR